MRLLRIDRQSRIPSQPFCQQLIGVVFIGGRQLELLLADEVDGAIGFSVVALHQKVLVLVLHGEPAPILNLVHRDPAKRDELTGDRLL